MIKEIKLAKFPCFGEDTVLSDLKEINYVFGPNGSGKTTISQHLARYDSSSSSSDPTNGSLVCWEKQPQTIKVYNRAYVRDCFASASGEEPGVFLLGDESREISERISMLEKEQAKINQKLVRDEKNLESFKADLSLKHTDLADKVWQRRDIVPSILKDNMPGMNASKMQCLNKVFKAAQNQSKCGDETFESLEHKAKAVFNESFTESTLILSPPEPSWDEASLQTTLKMRILGSNEMVLTELIKSLSAWDWVRQGLDYISHRENPENKCPFCQQKAPDDLEERLVSIFDKTYEKKRTVVEQFQKELSKAEDDLQKYEEANIERLKELCDADEVTRAFQSLKIAIKDVQKSVQEKRLKPSEEVDTTPIGSFYDRLKELVTEANEEIKSTNSLIANRRQQRDEVNNMAWRHFAQECLGDLIENYNVETEKIQKSVEGTEESIRKLQEKLDGVQRELSELMRRTTSSARAIKDINDLLEFSQFRSFKLEAATPKSGGYRIIRNDEQPADVETLSEGERTFITFLYYYHTLSALRQDGETERIVAVVDDPISSLDADIMFVVSALMRRLIEQVKEGKSQRVNQVILLTHNTRFHNEVCHHLRGQQSKKIKFYRIRKFSPDPNQIEDCGQTNPIRTVYQQLWDEVATAQSGPERSMPWLPNVLRRILESYFTTLGGRKNLYDLGEGLSMNERALHDALIAWSHSGSHTIIDAENYAQPAATNEKWLEAFARIFNSCDQGAHYGHYEMMMGEARQYLRVNQ